MYEAAKVRPKRSRLPPVSPPRDQSDVAWASDYKLSPVPQVTLDRNGRICRLNVAASVLLKGESTQLIDIPFIAFVDKAYCRLFLDHLAEAFRVTKRVCTRLSLSPNTRGKGPVELQSTPSLEASTGRLLCRTAIVSLSSRGRLAANDFPGDQAGYDKWFELFPDAAILEIGGRIVSVNPAALRLLGARNPDEVQGKVLSEIIHPASHRSFRERVSSLPEGRTEPTGAEERFIRLDAQEIVVNVVLKSINFDGVSATLVLARDLSKQREMEENLARAKDFSAQILANNTIATAILSLRTERFIETNEVFRSLANRADKEIVGQPLSAIGFTGVNDDHIDSLTRLTSGDDQTGFEGRINRPDGSVLEVLVSAKAIVSGGEPRLLLMIQDLTDLRRLRKDLVSISEEEQKRFSRDLHDNHCQELTAIAFFAETIVAGLAGRDDEVANQVQMLADMVRKSVENVHALAVGLDAQQIQESGLTVSLEELVSRIGRRFGLACTADIDRKFSEAGSTRAVHLYRIAQEAISNAAKHSHAHSITLRLRVQGDTCILKIQDDGIGFSAEKKPNGLGLRTMQYRASVIKGTLTIDSKPGSGTVVTCSFPVVSK